MQSNEKCLEGTRCTMYSDEHGCTSAADECYHKTLDERPASDMVNHPSHYTFSKYEVIDIIEAWFPNNYFLGNVLKYIARAEHKGEYLIDLRKARWYLDRLIKNVEEIYD